MINSRPSILVIISFSALDIKVVTNYLIFDQTAFAVDACDSSSNCTNTQTGIDNTQTNNCTDSSTCSNNAQGDSNTQINACAKAPSTEFVGGCENIAVGNDNNIMNNCTESTCDNLAIGEGNTQIVNCESVP